MQIVTIAEIIDMIVMIIGVGIIFSNLFKIPVDHRKYDPLDELEKGKSNDFIVAILISAPAVVFHEIAHKIAGLILGLHATFHANYMGLMLGIGLSFLKFPFIFFVPGYVEIYPANDPIVSSIVAFAGPALNLILWLSAWTSIRFGFAPKKYLTIIAMTAQINMLLFLFNMVPFPGLDGWTIWGVHVWKLVFAPLFH